VRRFARRSMQFVPRDARIERSARMIADLRRALNGAPGGQIISPTPKPEIQKAMESPTQPELFS
jgi:hypothetical protein